MANQVIDLTRAGSFQMKAITGDGQKLPEIAREYLQEVEIHGTSIRSCILKDSNSGSENGEYKNFRLAMLTIPQHFQYVNYSIASGGIMFEEKDFGTKLVDCIHTLVFANITQDEGSDEVFHICGHDNALLPKSFFSFPMACAVPLRSNINDVQRRFHLFYVEDTNEIQQSSFLIPLLLSQGTIVFYRIKKDDNKMEEKFRVFIAGVNDLKNSKKDYWAINNIQYSDVLDVFYSEDIQVGIQH